MVCIFVSILDSFYHVIQTVLENEVNCSDQVQNIALGKTLVATLMPYVSPASEVTFLCSFM